jgi:hypothetical protein
MGSSAVERGVEPRALIKVRPQGRALINASAHLLPEAGAQRTL